MFDKRRLTCAAALILFAACGPSNADYNDGSVNDPGIDADNGRPDAISVPRIDAQPIPDAGNVYTSDAAGFGDANFCGGDWMCTSPVPDGCDVGGPDVCGDGADNNCNGQVDEGCTCTSGAVQSCFRGPPGKRNVGACVDGMQTCLGSGEFTYWSECTGGIAPRAESCDSLDNSCNGCADDNPLCCDVDLMCPGTGDMPTGQPFTDYVIDGTAFYAGPVTSWAWTVTGGPCDVLLESTSGNTSYSLGGASTSVLTFSPTLSGDYTVTVTITTTTGEVLECTFIVHIEGPGIRFELCWDRTGGGPNNSDLDLHVHKPDSTTPWFSTNAGDDNPDDCYFRTCTGNSYHCTNPPVFGCPTVQADWGYADSPLSECEGGPLGSNWTTHGSCANPRLDIDNIKTAGIPENINIDAPENNKSYRAMVHYYSGTKVVAPMVNIYCGGVLKATFGSAPDTVPGFDAGGGFGAGPMWRVADVKPVVTGGVTTDCTIDQLHPQGMTDGYRVTNDDTGY